MPRAMFYFLRREMSGPVGILEPQTTNCLGRDSDTLRVSLIAQLVKNTPAMQETWVRFLGQEDPLENG